MLMDRITGSLVAAIGLLAVWGASRLPAMIGQPVGPSAFPTLVGWGLVITGGLIALGVGRSFEEGEGPVEDESSAPPPLWRAVIPVALLVFYVAVVDRLGFVPTAALIIVVTALALGARLFAALALAVVAAPLAHLLFLKLLRVPLAPGLLPMPW
jgi:putative tricarboxylic transport membrane protein